MGKKKKEAPLPRERWGGVRYVSGCFMYERNVTARLKSPCRSRKSFTFITNLIHLLPVMVACQKMERNSGGGFTRKMQLLNLLENLKRFSFFRNFSLCVYVSVCIYIHTSPIKFSEKKRIEAAIYRLLLRRRKLEKRR